MFAVIRRPDQLTTWWVRCPEACSRRTLQLQRRRCRRSSPAWLRPQRSCSSLHLRSAAAPRTRRLPEENGSLTFPVYFIFFEVEIEVQKETPAGVRGQASLACKRKKKLPSKQSRAEQRLEGRLVLLLLLFKHQTLQPSPHPHLSFPEKLACRSQMKMSNRKTPRRRRRGRVRWSAEQKRRGWSTGWRSGRERGPGKRRRPTRGRGRCLWATCPSAAPRRWVEAAASAEVVLLCSRSLGPVSDAPEPVQRGRIHRVHPLPLPGTNV